MLGTSSNQYLIQFELDREYYGLFLEQLTRIVALEHAMPLPKTPPSIYGVTNYKGKIVTIVNTAYIMNKEVPENVYLGLLDGNYSHIGVMISEKIETLTASIKNLNPLSEGKTDIAGNAVLAGEILLNNHMVQIISPEKLYNYLLEEVQLYLRKEFEILIQD